MLVIQGTTPEETRTSIVEFLLQEAASYNRAAQRQRLKGERSRDIARANAITLAANAIRDCTLADLRADTERRRTHAEAVPTE